MLLPSGLSVWPLLCPFVCVCMCFEDTQAGESLHDFKLTQSHPLCFFPHLCTFYIYRIPQCGDSLLAFPVFIFLFFYFFHFFIFSYIVIFSRYLSLVTLSPQCSGSPSGTHAFKDICLMLVGKTKFACSSVSLRDADYISMSSRLGQTDPLSGGRSLGPCYNMSR